MAAATYDLYIEQGATFRLTMIYGRKDGTVDVNGNANVEPYDITGCQARMQIRQRQGGTVLIAATTTHGGISIPTGTDGKIVITITDEATDSVTVKRGVYDLEVSYPSGDVVRILQGKVTFSPNITQGAELADISNGLGDVHAVDEQDVEVDTQVDTQPSTAF